MRVVIADLDGRDGEVSKDTVAGGYGSRFRADSATTRFLRRMRSVFLNLPSIQTGYLAAIFAEAGHEVVVTRDDKKVEGDLALVLTSLVDHKHEREWAVSAKERGMKVGFFGTAATHMPELFADAADFVIKGEPEAAALRIAAGSDVEGIVLSPQIDDLDSLPFPRWDLVGSKGLHARHSGFRATHAMPMLTSRSCPEHCTYCPHRITAQFRARSVGSVIAEMAELCARYDTPHIKIRDPLFTLSRERCIEISHEIVRRGLQLTWECETRMDDLDEELIRVMAGAGLREIGFGVESPDPLVLKRVGRRYIPHEHIRKMVRLCHSLGIVTTAFYIIGFLQETEEMIEDTIQLACDLDTTLANFKILTPYPGTPQFKQLKHLIFEEDWEQFDGYTLTFKHPVLTPQRARLMIGMANSRFYVRPSHLFKFLGMRKVGQLGLMKRADLLSWRLQDHLDRSWRSQRQPVSV